MEFSPTRDSTRKLRFSVVSELSSSNLFSLATAQNLLGLVASMPAQRGLAWGLGGCGTGDTRAAQRLLVRETVPRLPGCPARLLQT